MAEEQQQELQVMEPEAADIGAYFALDCSQEDITEFLTILQENTEGETIGERDLQRVTVPPQGIKSWQISYPDGDKTTDNIRGVLVKITSPRARWDDDGEGGTLNEPPVCSSHDSVTGVGSPGGECLACPFNQWGTGRNGEGKACKEKRMLFMLQEKSLLPMVVQAPTTSIEPLRQYRIQLSGESRYFYGVETELTLEKVDGRYPYSRIVPRMVGELNQEQRERVKNYSEALTPILAQSVPVVRDEDTHPAIVEADNPAPEPDGDLPYEDGAPAEE